MTETNKNALLPGQFLSEYKIEKILGSGGFGITYRAIDTHLNKKVAIKEYFPNEIAVRENQTTISPKSDKFEGVYISGIERFLDEAKALAQFNHPNIVKVLRFFSANGTAYFVMDYYEGISLNDYFERTGKTLNERNLLKVFLPVLSGLKIVHQAGLIHRDIKPANIYLRKNDGPLLIDFGAARYSIGQASKNLSMILTPGYAPFEQYQTDGKKQGPWTDIYALSAAMYHCITGQTPPGAPDRVNAVLEGDQDPYIPVSRKAKGQFNNNILQAIDEGLKYKTNQRPKNVDQFRALLNINTEPPPEQPPALSEYKKFFEFSIIDNRITQEERKALRQKAEELSISQSETQRIERTILDKAQKLVCPKCGALNKQNIKICQRCKQKLDTKEPEIKAGTKPDSKNNNKIWKGIFMALGWLFLGFFIILSCDDEPDALVGSLLAIASGIVIVYKRKKGINGIELSIYWLGISAAFIILSTVIFDEMNWSWIGEYNDEETGSLFGLLLAIASGIVIAYKRKNYINGVELTIYWLGISTAFIFSSMCIFYVMDGDNETGLLCGSLIALVSGIYLFRWYKKNAGLTKK